MASATSFYDFKPLDSTSHLSPAFFLFSRVPRIPVNLFISFRITSHHADIPLLKEKGQPYPLSNLKNKVVLIVNTASKCGFTPQFEGLEKLYKKIKTDHPDDFIILGFPCNQFMQQDPGDNDTIQSFCLTNYGVSFPVLGKTDVNGDKAEPLYEWMKAQIPGVLGLKRIKWNFEKFLVGKDGVNLFSFYKCVMLMFGSKSRAVGRVLRSRRAWSNRYWRH